jgi:hypothetical protein
MSSLHGFHMASNGSYFMVTWTIFKNHLLDVGLTQTSNTHNHWFILFYHAWGLAWIKILWNSIWMKAQSHMTSHYTRGSMTTLHELGGVLGQPLHTFFWALTISWSHLLARMWNGPNKTPNQFIGCNLHSSTYLDFLMITQKSHVALLLRSLDPYACPAEVPILLQISLRILRKLNSQGHWNLVNRFDNSWTRNNWLQLQTPQST